MMYPDRHDPGLLLYGGVGPESSEGFVDGLKSL